MEYIHRPLLVLGYNRPDYLSQLLTQIEKERQNRKIYISIDGAKSGEDYNHKKVTKLALDWAHGFNVDVFVSDENLGCKRSIQSAITRVLEIEEDIIVLEDDCIPNSSFFSFMDTSLRQTRNESRIGMITGTNYFPDIAETAFLSRHYSVWGWATWRDVWNKQFETCYDDIEMHYRTKLRASRRQAAVFKKRVEGAISGKIDTWDIQWAYFLLSSGLYCLTPPVNLVSNVGVSGTHSSYGKTINHKMPTMDYKASYDLLIEPNLKYDVKLTNRKFPNLLVRILNKLLNVKKFILQNKK